MNLKLPGFTITSWLQEGTKTFTCRAIRDVDGCPVIVKGLRSEQCTIGNIEQLKHEYAIAQKLNLPGTVRVLSLELYRGMPFLILEDFGGQSLDRVLDRFQEIRQFLKLALQIVAAIAQIHQNHIVHKDIKPQNIIINLETEQVKIGDFGLAAFIPYNSQLVISSNRIEGSLPYISPEQTGRMNRGIDGRSDLYSLGVTFYEILTGQLPFAGNDPLEWIHCHIAKEAIAPKEINPYIPQAVSDIIMKLLAKVAEARYQSAAGLQFDLERCWQSLETTRQIQAFNLGEQDISDRLQIPQKLYGREQEINQLLGAFTRVVTQGTPELILVSGYSGIGKSSLVNELHKLIVQTRSIFLSGKFDRYKRDIPYATIIQGFQQLVRQLLTEPEDKLAIWRHRIQACIGKNGKLITDVIPEVELIIGQQAPVPELGPAESQNRFNLVFQNFISAFAQSEHPLAIFLDDMQWADSATLNLIEAIATGSNIQYLCFLLAYRDNEVDAFHPFGLMLQKLHQQGIQATEIVLSPLALRYVNELISDTLRCSLFKSQPLAQLVFDKTAGNPFFVNEFLKTLYQENLLSFDYSQRAWQWDLKQIEAQDITDNVVNLTIKCLQKLPSVTQKVLQLASCIGNHFDLENLAIVAEESEASIIDTLKEAVLRGLIVAIEQPPETPKHYYFVHDRIQQAAYALIPNEQKQIVHLQIGRLLLKNFSSQQLQEELFDVLNQLNLGRDEITEQSEKDELVRLNLLAGKRAKASTAYAPALKYFQTAAILLSSDAWHKQYCQTFDLFIELAECQYLTGNLDSAEVLFKLLLNKARSNLDKANIYMLQVRLYQVASRFAQAFEVGLEALKLFNIVLPKSDEEVEAAIATERNRTKINLGDRQIADIINAPIIQDPFLKVPISLLTSLGPPAYLSKPNLFPLIVLKALNHSLQFGNTEESCFAYSMYSMLLVSIFRDIPGGYAFSEMTIRLNQKLNDPKYKGTVLHIHGSHINVWCNHIATDLPFLEQGFLGCIEAGDITMANYNGFQGSWQMIEAIFPLTEAYQATQKYTSFAQQSKHQAAYQTIRLQQQFIQNLRGLTDNYRTLNDAHFDEYWSVEIIANAGFTSGIVFYHIIKLIIFFTYECYLEAFDSALAAHKVLGAILSLPIEANYLLHHSLVLAALYPNQSSQTKAEFLATLQQHQQQLQYWAEHCAANFLHKSLLVAAEIARIEGRDWEAMRLYEQSINSAREHQFVQYEALSHELAAKFYLSRDFEAIAKTYLQEAKNCYLRWGATRKARQLEEKYYNLLPVEQPTVSKNNFSSSNATFISSGVQLDILSVVKASQTISSEIILPDLLKTLMQIVIEQAGAEIGYLLLKRNGNLVIEVEAKANQKTEQLSINHFTASVQSSKFVPQLILNYVQRTQEVVILDNAAKPNLFSEDEYLIQNQPKSILCLPITYQSNLIGILYLENNLFTKAFTQTQLSALEILSTQIGISLENARLYQELAESQEQLNLALQAGQIGIWSWDILNDRVEWDEQMYQLFGVSPESFDCTLEAVVACLHPDDRDYFQQRLNQTLTQGVEHNIEYRVILNNGNIRHIAARGRLFFNDARQPIRMRGIVLDITERQLAEQRQLQLVREQTARAEAEAANRIKDEFLAVLSHELRSPLNPILGWSKLLQRGKLNPAKTAEALATIERNAKLQSELIEDLLDVSRILQGKLSLNIAPVNLVATIQAAKETVRLAAEAKSIEIITNLDSQAAQVLGDANRLQQVVWNLLSNAVKFTPIGGRVEVRLEQVDWEPGKIKESKTQKSIAASPHFSISASSLTYAQITVADNGKGIEPDFLPHVFEYFRQADSATTRKFGGLGLGLAIVHHLVELHGGTIWAESEGEGMGATFRVRLPMRAAPATKSDTEISESSLNLEGIEILLIDDDNDTREFVAFVLEQAGAKVIATSCATEALTALTQSLPDVLVSDIGMPEIDGYMLIRQIRALPPEQGGEIPAIALTAYAGDMNQQQALAAGFEQHLSKPIDPEKLISAIVNLVRI
ncbi:MAG: AAA family ATPase [Nostoc sp. ChiSLP02]|nr:AAA family ATPase [Nostoc sp. DedSLP05]MDZ8103280.1 AAA family ATPase [Nostoc sp. DedSLP01]MDZ8187728.1 AAA family ATPase [Nostoc sp. ChiSLP02]